MSELLEKNPEDYEGYDPVERPVLKRTYAAELYATDGRNVDVRVVPYGVTADVSDDGQTTYREQWEHGCFDDQLVAGHRLKVLLNFEHGRGISNIVGKGVSLRSQPDGLHGSFRILETQDGDKALELVRAGILDGVSLEAHPKKSIRTVDGVVKRVRAHLHNVALCRTPAFADARVLAVREQHILIDESLLPVEIDPELVERCRLLGIEIPAALAHPDQPDTPASTGTSEDGTRQADETATSEEP